MGRDKSAATLQVRQRDGTKKKAAYPKVGGFLDVTPGRQRWEA
jgi:hypothetical protein